MVLKFRMKHLKNIFQKIFKFISAVISKIAISIVFVVVFIPASIIIKILGKDLLNKKIDKNEISYWLKREIQPTSLRNQF